MKISLNWLSDYVQIEESPEQVAEILSDLGFPCEGIEHLNADTVIDAEITSNRGDCLGHIGIARELAAATGKELRLPAVVLKESNKDVSEFAEVEIAEPELCGRYTARIIEGVKVGPSPGWMKERLAAVGVRSVNNVVDASNYAMLETGQPPHAFDYARIGGGRIIVRKAAAGENLVSIDGSKCKLAEDMLIIADANGPVAIAGVMGGLDSEVGNKTVTILLEDAYFDAVSVRSTSRRLALPSEASFRFERIVDIERVDWASKRTAQLIIQVAGGKVAKGVVDVYPKKWQQKQVSLRLSRLAKLLGIEVPTDKVLSILLALGFQPRHRDDSVVCAVPSWRSDVYREADLIEEVARVHGYGKVPTERKIEIEVVPVDGRQKLAGKIGKYLNGCGFYEAITLSFVDESVAELFAASDAGGHLAVRDVSTKSTNLLRQTLIGSLLSVLKTNLNAKNMPCRIFEIADTFVATAQGLLPIEKTKVAIACDSDLRGLRGVIEGLINDVAMEAAVVFRPADLPWAEASAEIVVNGVIVGAAGIISKAVKEKFDFKEARPCAAEIDFEQLMGLQSESRKVRRIAKFPAIERDLSIIVDERVSWSEIIEAVKRKAPAQLEEVQFVGIYRGKGIAVGKKSVTLSLRFRDEDGTLRHDTVDGFEADIVAELAESAKAELRTV